MHIVLLLRVEASLIMRLSHLYASVPAVIRQRTAPPPPIKPTRSMSPPSSPTVTRSTLPPRKCSLGTAAPRARQGAVRQIERSIILHDRYILLHGCKSFGAELSLLDYWHLDLLHDLLICRQLISPEACQKILDQRAQRRRTLGITTYLETKYGIMESEISRGSGDVPCLASNILRAYLQGYEELERECLINLATETHKRMEGWNDVS